MPHVDDKALAAAKPIPLAPPVMMAKFLPTMAGCGAGIAKVLFCDDSACFRNSSLHLDQKFEGGRRLCLIPLWRYTVAPPLAAVVCENEHGLATFCPPTTSTCLHFFRKPAIVLKKRPHSSSNPSAHTKLALGGE